MIFFKNMKYLLVAFISFLLFQNCKNPNSQSVDFSIKVHNHDEIDSLSLIGVDWETLIKFKLDEKGFFKTRIPLDSTVVGAGLFGRRNGKPTGDLFSLVLSQNGKSHYTIDDIYQAPETAFFEGDLTKTNRYYLLKAKMINAIDDNEELGSDRNRFDHQVEDFVSILDTNISIASEEMGETWAENQRNSIHFFVEHFEKKFSEEALRKQHIGKDFSNTSFLTEKGKYVDLSRFKGKYVYIDFWATWCAPCIREYPSFIKLKQSFNEDEIAFLQIGVLDDFEKWKNYMNEKNYDVNQNLFDSINRFDISSLPTFAMLDLEGELLSLNMPRPSDKNIKAVIQSLMQPSEPLGVE